MKHAFIVMMVLGAASSACTVWAEDRDRRGVRGGFQEVRYPPTDTGTSTAPEAAPSDNVVVDADMTMNAVGGAGVGVFVEYKKGGFWRIALSCDTAQSTQACAFKVRVSGSALSNVTLTDIPVADVLGSTTALQLDTAVGREIPVLNFQNTAGAPITLEASVDQVRDSGMFFFVGGGAVRGGNSAAVTNPLTFTPSTP